MNICFFHGGFMQHGGIGRVVSIIANGMSKEPGYSVYSLSFFKTGEENAYLIDPAVKEDFLYNSYRSMTKAILTNGILKLCRYIQKKQISVIVSCGVLYYPLGTICARICGIRSICWEHTNPEFSGDYRFQNFGRKFGAKYSYANILISQEAKHYYDLHFPQSNNVLIWNPAADELFEKSGQYDLNSRKIISVGRLSYPKNFMRLLEIAKKLDERENDWHWDIFGDGEEREQLEKRIEQLGLGKRITLKGNVNDLYTRYHEYIAIVMTSRYEGFPMTLIEGAANGLPMIAFDVKTGPKEIIRDGENGFLINEQDDEAMVNAIIRLFNDRQLRTRMSEMAEKSVCQYRLDNILRLWANLLNLNDDEKED